MYEVDAKHCGNEARFINPFTKSIGEKPNVKLRTDAPKGETCCQFLGRFLRFIGTSASSSTSFTRAAGIVSDCPCVCCGDRPIWI